MPYGITLGMVVEGSVSFLLLVTIFYCTILNWRLKRLHTDRETLSRIFNPFFTTKHSGHGLGLAAVQGIVRGHRGALHVDSTPGKGSRFCVWFPIVQQASGSSIPRNPSALSSTSKS